MAKKNSKTTPKTKLRFAELLGDRSIGKLAKVMGVTYTQLYPYKKDGVNPTLLALEQLADGLSELRGERITVENLIGRSSKRQDKTK